MTAAKSKAKTDFNHGESLASNHRSRCQIAPRIITIYAGQGPLLHAFINYTDFGEGHHYGHQRLHD